MHTYVHVCVYRITIFKRPEAVNLKESKDRYMGGFGGRKEKRDDVSYNLKNKIIYFKKGEKRKAF